MKFFAYLETLIAANSTNAAGNVRQHRSPWLLTDAANTIFQVAKRRCYIVTSPSKIPPPSPVIDLVDDHHAWEVIDELEWQTGAGQGKRPNTDKERRPFWLPDGIDPVLEELPKWTLLAEVLKEIEEELMRQEALGTRSTCGFPPFFVLISHRQRLSLNVAVIPGSDTVLVMTSSPFTSDLIGEFLSTMDADAPRGSQGRTMMLQKLRRYLWWKSKLNEEKPSQPEPPNPTKGVGGGTQHNDASGLSEAMKKKDKEKAQRLASRRRVRGGAVPSSGASGSTRTVHSEAGNNAIERNESAALAAL